MDGDAGMGVTASRRRRDDVGSAGKRVFRSLCTHLRRAEASSGSVGREVLGFPRIDLQLFAEEKTEPATPRKREEARRRGHVLRSREVTQAASLVAGLLVLGLVAGDIKAKVQGFAVRTWGSLDAFDLSFATVLWLTRELGYAVLVTVLPLLAVALVVSISSNILIGGLVFSGSQLGPDFSRLDPAAGLRRLFSGRSLFETVKALLKLLGISYVVWKGISSTIEIAPVMLAMDLWEGISVAVHRLFRSIIESGLVLSGLAFLDYYYQRKEFEAGLRMTKEELKEELKRSEGQPEAKARQRERQRLIARMRMLARVKKADVVVTNPEHCAAALKYDPERMAAPVLIAKGKGIMASRIKDEAYRHGIPVISNPPLAWMLYNTVEVGRAIPPELYKAVAEVLAYVYRTMNRMPKVI
ncbi:MAG TPA: EscU/YscU/HrcU family type III secretion system export apparatus switch protein [Clostridia bacterium]|nr:EscU/YscU/HrcU family type III secretion system export apparatus switch protein [Clostridia bacterium]